MPADRFCDLCDVSLDLHPNGRSEEAIDCTIAEAKANLLDRFGRPFVPFPTAAPSPVESSEGSGKP